MRVEDDHGNRRLGRVRSPADHGLPCPETTETCWHILRDFLVPSVDRQGLGDDRRVPRRCSARSRGNSVRPCGPGNGLRGTCCRAGRRASRSRRCWAARERRFLSGVSLGIERPISSNSTSAGLIDQYLAEGYRRIKLKIGPGNDVEVVRAGPRAISGNRTPGRCQFGLHAGGYRDAEAARRVRSPPDRAAPGARRHHRPRAIAIRPQHARLPRPREHPFGRRREEGASKSAALPRRSTSRSAASAACARRSGFTTSVMHTRSPSGAAGCTSSASAGRRTWRSRAFRVSPCRAISPAPTSIIVRTSRRAARSCAADGAIRVPSGAGLGHRPDPARIRSLSSRTAAKASWGVGR